MLVQQNQLENLKNQNSELSNKLNSLASDKVTMEKSFKEMIRARSNSEERNRQILMK